MRADELLAGLKEYDALDAAQFPDEQNHGVVILLQQSKILQRLVACWPSVPLPPDSDPRQEVPAGMPITHHLRWLWARIEPDPIPEWLALSGLPDAPHTRRWAQVAIDNRMVFPDGTRSKWANQFITSRARDVLAGG